MLHEYICICMYAWVYVCKPGAYQFDKNNEQIHKRFLIKCEESFH